MKVQKKLVVAAVGVLLGLAGVGWASQAKLASPAPPSVPAKPAAQAHQMNKPAIRWRTERGTIVSSSERSLVLSHKEKGKTEETNFVLEPSTQKEGTLTDGAIATVRYRVENGEKVAALVRVHPTKAAKPTSTKAKSRP